MSRIGIVLLIAALLAVAGVLLFGLRSRRIGQASALTTHDRPPQHGALTPDELKLVEEQRQAPYAQYVRDLLPAVRDKVVEGSRAGRSGYLLRFRDGTWSAFFVAEGQLRWRVGSIGPDADVLTLLDSPEAGDGRPPLTIDYPYADQECDITAEVAKSHGQPVTGIAIGSNVFNLVFPGDRELDAVLVPDKDGVLALRVFWEQW